MLDCSTDSRPRSDHYHQPSLDWDYDSISPTQVVALFRFLPRRYTRTNHRSKSEWPVKQVVQTHRLVAKDSQLLGYQRAPILAQDDKLHCHTLEPLRLYLPDLPAN